MQTITENMDVDWLVATSETLEMRLSQLAADSQSRETVIGAIEKLIEKYILPAMVDCPLSSAPLDTFDLDAVAGTKVRGLVLGLFEEKMHELEKPSDETLKQALNYIEVPISDAAQRNRFYRCWAAEQANSSILKLIQFLQTSLTGINPAKIESARSEQIRVENILKNKLPDGLEFALESFRERLNRGI